LPELAGHRHYVAAASHSVPVHRPQAGASRLPAFAVRWRPFAFCFGNRGESRCFCRASGTSAPGVAFASFSFANFSFRCLLNVQALISPSFLPHQSLPCLLQVSLLGVFWRDSTVRFPLSAFSWLSGDPSSPSLGTRLSLCVLRRHLLIHVGVYPSHRIAILSYVGRLAVKESVAVTKCWVQLLLVHVRWKNVLIMLE